MSFIPVNERMYVNTDNIEYIAGDPYSDNKRCTIKFVSNDDNLEVFGKSADDVIALIDEYRDFEEGPPKGDV
jgi:hypothetical protein